MAIRWTSAALLAGCTALTALPASAAQRYIPAPAINQNPDPNVPVYARPRPEYDPLGLRLGSFFLFPEVFAGLDYDTNVDASEENERDDFIFRVRPAATLQSNWSRHAVLADLYVDAGKYVDADDYDYLDVGARGRGRYDISSDARVLADLRYDRLHQSSDDPDNLTPGETSQYDRLRGSLAYQQVFGRFFGGLTALATDYSFGDGNESSDRTETNLRARLGYNVSPAVGVFGQVDYIDTAYDNEFRDSSEIRVSGGASLDFTSILFGEIYAGYSDVKFDNDLFDDTSGLSVGGSLVWNITQLTTIDFNVDRNFDATAVVGASSNYKTNIGIDVTHELRRNVLVSAGLVYENSEYEGTDREDDTLRATLGASYLLNRHFTVDAAYEFSNRDSSEVGGDYLRNLFTVGVTARL